MKSAAKSKSGTTLRITKENVQDKELPDQLFLTRRQKTKRRNAFAKNMPTGIKFSKAQLSKVVQSGRFLGVLLGKLTGLLIKIAASLAKNMLLWHSFLQ